MTVPTRVHQAPTLEFVFHALLLSLAFVVLYVLSLNNFLLFHSLAEGVSIIIAFSMSIVAWNSRKYIINPYLLFVGVSYFFIASIDLLHTLSYRGMPLFAEPNDYATQLWIAARYTESVTLWLGFLFLRYGIQPVISLVLPLYWTVLILVALAVFYWHIFPLCFIDGVGLTPFKIYSEYVICLVLLLALFPLFAMRERFEQKVFYLIFSSIVCTICAELSFTFYISVYGLSNILGHFFKLLSYLFMYYAIIRTGIERPMKLIFLELERSNHRLKAEVEERRRIAQENSQLIEQLQGALEDIKTLEGILPICMHCKKIRDDQGYWNRIEQYISDHSEAMLSHGICPECAAKHYPKEFLGKGNI